MTTYGIEHGSKKPGGNIDCWCGKCKLTLAHTIEAMVGDKPARVCCNTCRSQHGYRSEPAPARGEPKSRAPKRTAKGHAALLEATHGVTAKDYSPRNKYEQGDIFNHPTFGRGITTAVKDGTKIEVRFETGSKTLVHGM